MRNHKYLLVRLVTQIRTTQNLMTKCWIWSLGKSASPACAKWVGASSGCLHTWFLSNSEQWMLYLFLDSNASGYPHACIFTPKKPSQGCGLVALQCLHFCCLGSGTLHRSGHLGEWPIWWLNTAMPLSRLCGVCPHQAHLQGTITCLCTQTLQRWWLHCSTHRMSTTYQLIFLPVSPILCLACQWLQSY